MKKSSYFFKLIIIIVLPCIVFWGTYHLKEYLNQANIKNKNYLATTIRNNDTKVDIVKTNFVNEALSRQEFVAYCKRFSENQRAPLKFVLTDVTNFEDEATTRREGELIGVQMKVVHGLKLFVERNYVVQAQRTSNNQFECLSKGEVDLKKNILRYQVRLVDESLKPAAFINYLEPLSEEVQAHYPDRKFISRISVLAADKKYIYYSDKPNNLIRVEEIG